MRNETWKLNYSDGTSTHVYCKKNELLDHITARQYVNLISVEIMNRGDDKADHKPVSKEQL